MQTDIIEELEKTVTDIKEVATGLRQDVNEAKTTVTGVQSEQEHLREDVQKLRRVWVQSQSSILNPQSSIPKGFVSDECAAYLGSSFILHCAKSGKLEVLSQSPTTREAMLTIARQTVAMQTRTALTTTDIPLPIGYAGELRALIAQFGVVRKAMFPYPIGMGTAKPPRMGARPQFASIAMSAAVPEGSPTITFAALESHKIGGLVRVPREIDEQSIVPMGQFLARYGAVEFARVEDTWGFLADGTGTYEGVKGVVQICAEATTANTLVSLSANKTAASDATIAEFRQMRLGVKTPALGTGRYYLNGTWEQRLRTFKTPADPEVYNQNGPNGHPTLDGYDVIWTEVLAPYTLGIANPGACLAVFGDLSYWWMGEHLSPRIDTSDQVFFVNDQLAVRFIEEIDFDYMDTQAASALKTAAN